MCAVSDASGRLGNDARFRDAEGAETPWVKPFVAVLTAPDVEFAAVVAALESIWGAIDLVSPPVAFVFTDYYTAEMGPDLTRRLVSFRELAPADRLAVWKRTAAALERTWTRPANGGRRVNLDPGYVDYHRLVLASFKPGRHKIYLNRGVWADLTLLYEHGAFQPLPWTFPDFRSGVYSGFLRALRNHFKQQMRTRGLTEDSLDLDS